jgi:ankyrin repeat protein
LPGALQDATGPRKGLRPPEGTTKDATTSFGPTARTTAVNEGGIMSEPSRALPPRPSLEQQQKLAKELLKALRAGDAEARERIRQHLPDKQVLTLADAQFAIAREYGFESWRALKAHIELLDGGIPKPVLDELQRAFHAGDAKTVRELFERHPAARAMIDAPRFPFDSPAVVHVAGAGDLAMVDVLLELGADPNRRSDWWAGGFHALHSARGAVADRLLEAGAVPDACAAANLDRPQLLERILDADPSRVHERGGDGQTPLHFARSRDVVDLLLERGADPDARDVDHRSAPAQWMLAQRRGAGRYTLAEYLVERGATVDVFMAAALGLAPRLRELIEADPSLIERRTGRGEYGEQPPSSFHIYTWTIGQHLSPLQVAAQFEQEEALEVLRAGASPKVQLLAAFARGSASEADELLREWPALLDELTADDMRALPDAGWAGNAAAVDLMLGLGLDAATGGQDGGTVLHCAAWQGSVACVEAALRHDGPCELIERRDPVHGSTPLGWCCHGARHCRNPSGDYPAVARLLLEAGAQPGPNLNDAPADVLAAIRGHAPNA